MIIETWLSIFESFSEARTDEELHQVPSIICRSIRDLKLASSSYPKADTGNQSQPHEHKAIHMRTEAQSPFFCIYSPKTNKAR